MSTCRLPVEAIEGYSLKNLETLTLSSLSTTHAPGSGQWQWQKSICEQLMVHIRCSWLLDLEGFRAPNPYHLSTNTRSDRRPTLRGNRASSTTQFGIRCAYFASIPRLGEQMSRARLRRFEMGCRNRRAGIHLKYSNVATTSKYNLRA